MYLKYSANMLNMKMILIVIQTSFFICISATSSDMKKEIAPESLETCLDHKGKVVSHGDRFFPLGSDPCTQCTCRNGKPETCISVFCSPPENCRQYHALSDKCCEFVCLDRDFPNKGSGNSSYPDPDSLNTTNLGLRLVASTVTSFLILALLLFMIHRLRQRRLLLMIRRFHARRMDNGTAHLSRRYSEDDDGSVGYFVGHDHLDFSRYDEPPPPYTLWKPTEMYIPPGEAPPPYDLSVQLTAPFSGHRRLNNSCNVQASAARESSTTTAIQHASTESSQPNITVTTAVISNSAEPQTEHQQFVTSAEPTREVQSAGETSGYASHDRVALPPDSQYEEPNAYNLTTNTSTTSSYQEPVQNANEAEVADATLQTTSAISPVIEEPSTSVACTCSTIENEAHASNKRQTCSEYGDSSTMPKLNSKYRRDRRLSLSSTTHTRNNNIYPDPTAWNGEVSESSSSSSPTYEQPTPSPSTSDSSYADAEYGRRGRGEFIKHCYVMSPFPEDASVSTRTSSHLKNRDGIDDDTRTPAFQKTLSNLKRFSLIKRKRKKRLEEKAVEISCSLVCQSISDAIVLSPQPLNRPEIPLGAKLNDEQSSRPIEAINPHIGHKLASSGIRRPRPTTIGVSSELYRPRGSSSRHSNFYGPLYTPDPNMPLSTVVAIHHRPKTKNSRNHAGRASSSSDGRSVAPQKQVGTSNDSPPSRSGKRITRSGSICSETGERRYHKSNPSSPGSSHSRHLPQESNHSQGMASTENPQYSSQICMTNESRSYRIEQALQNAHIPEADDTIRTLPVWIVNSESVLPRQDFRAETNSSSGLISRCLSMGQIGENYADATFGSNLHPALQIRDPSMCDSSWEACSHL